jgi:hypothetical protein
MRNLLAVALVITLGLAGCGKQAPPPPPGPNPGGASIESQLTEKAAPPPPSAAGEPISTGVATDVPEQEKSLKELTAALQTYMQVSSDYPKDLNALVKMKLLKKMPTPPPGKRFVIDPKNIRVILAD